MFSKIIIIGFIFYICYQTFNNMDIEKTLKFSLFAGLSLLPAALGLLLFDYTCLYKFQLIKDFEKTSLIAIVLVYAGIAVLIRLLMYSALNLFKDKQVRMIANTTNFMTLFYIVCVDVFIYSSIPIIITYYKHGSYIHFIQNTLLVWFLIFIYWILWMLKWKNKKIIN